MIDSSKLGRSRETYSKAAPAMIKEETHRSLAKPVKANPVAHLTSKNTPPDIDEDDIKRI